MHRKENLYDRLHSIPDLRLRLDIISTEEFNFFSKISHYFANKLDEIKTFFKSDLITYKNKSDPFVKELKDSSKLLNSIQDVKYSVIADIVVPVNELFSTNLLEIMTKLERIAEPINDKYLITLDKTDEFISKLISNPEYAESSRPEKTDPEVLKLIELGYSTIDSIINPNLRFDNREIKDLIPNISCLTDIVSKVEKIDNLYMYKNAIKSDKIVKDINAKIVTLTGMIKTNNIRNFNKGVLTQLGTNIEDSARLVTLVATILYIQSQVCSITSNIINVIHNVSVKSK